MQPTRIVRSKTHLKALMLSTIPIWSCSRRGLPCHFCCQKCGELLPRHFTLTFIDIKAVYFLWHFP
ncbi:hypothetical protein lam_720 [Candidatus Liberibacter americanus str. Sao Paulo]|uniref:Uncharacterized protein n=1 Tax=Candidatus Liberibacter americanus str. Sao Paulo TaxID=1261131 RepID=U6B873_9HYPH|nr:hypothetical protein lam_720 [Candidatus Liberibacter americanus str. Sao Paulo]